MDAGKVAGALTRITQLTWSFGTETPCPKRDFYFGWFISSSNSVSLNSGGMCPGCLWV